MATALTGLTGKMIATMRLTGVKALDLASVSDALNKTCSTTIAFGTGANQANLLWHDQRALVADASEGLDLEVLTGPHGTANFASVNGLLFYNSSITASELTFGNAAGTQFQGPMGAGTNTLIVGAGDYFMWVCAQAAGWTTSSQNVLKIAENSTLAALYDIVIVGRSG